MHFRGHAMDLNLAYVQSACHPVCPEVSAPMTDGDAVYLSIISRGKCSF